MSRDEQFSIISMDWFKIFWFVSLMNEVQVQCFSAGFQKSLGILSWILCNKVFSRLIVQLYMLADSRLIWLCKHLW